MGCQSDLLFLQPFTPEVSHFSKDLNFVAIFDMINEKVLKDKEVLDMGDKSKGRREVKKKKKVVATEISTSMPEIKTVVTQPEVIKKPKKDTN